MSAEIRAGSVTSRGFLTLVEIEEPHRYVLTVRESSRVGMDKVWLFLAEGAVTEPHKPGEASALLGVEEAEALIAALQEFMMYGDDPAP